MEAGHGCLVNRKASVWQDKAVIVAALLVKDWQAVIETVIRIERRFQRYDPGKKVYQESKETAWYISNRSLDAAQAHGLVRHHWGIENTNNYVRDVTLYEDSSRIRVNPENMSVLRSAALNIIRYNKATNVREELYLNSLDWRRTYSYQHCI